MQASLLHKGRSAYFRLEEQLNHNHNLSSAALQALPALCLIITKIVQIAGIMVYTISLVLNVVGVYARKSSNALHKMTWSFIPRSIETDECLSLKSPKG